MAQRFPEWKHWPSYLKIIAWFCDFYICSEIKNYCCPWHTHPWCPLSFSIIWMIHLPEVFGFHLMWIHFAWTAQLTTTFSYNLENVFVLYCWLLAGNAQGHFFLPIYLLLIAYLFLLLELFGNFTRRAFSGPSPLAIVYCQRLHLRT